MTKVLYAITGILVLLYAYYLHIIMAFDGSFVMAILGTFIFCRALNKTVTVKEIETRYHSSVYKYYFAYDKKQIEEFDQALKDAKIDLSEACLMFDIKKDF